LTLVSAPFSIEELLRSVVASLVGMIEARPIEILIDIASDIPDVFVGDRFRLQQVLLNLCGNAAKFTSSGVITIGLRKQHTDEAQATCRFWVQDTGTGIAPEFMGKLFDIYAQEISISPCPQGGSGLGLSICSRLVQLMGGSMDVQSNRGLGSEFGFTIPLQTDCVPLSSQLPAHLKDLRVLVISDHDRLLSNVQRTCVGFSWQVDALDATAATTALHQPATQANTPYDLIMLDWRAEDSGVAEFLRGLPGSSWAATGHFLFLSSIGDMDLAQLAMNTLRFSNLVTRPITPFSLLKDVSILLQADRPVAVVTSFAPRQQLLGMRFLVADDNLLNQEILELILCKAGAEVVLVSDGAQAVAQLRASGQAFDAVLMDLQMPVLDGYAATQVIRKELGLVDLPIIAVTGLARPESHQKSEQAGLSGHLVKPLNVQKLLDILARVCNKPISPSVAQAEAPLPAQLPAISLSGLDIPSAMESFAGDLPLYLRLLERFLAAHSDDAAGASKLVECGNIKGAFDLLHTLQGTANMLRATDLIQLTAAAELALMDEHSEEVPALLQGIAQAMAVVAESVDQLRVVCTQQGNT
jgi:CheY-like chemotaxis protein